MHQVPGRRAPVVQAIDDFVAGVVRVETRTEENAAGQVVTGGSGTKGIRLPSGLLWSPLVCSVVGTNVGQ